MSRPPLLICPSCGHAVHGLVEQCPHEDWDDDFAPCGCRFRRGDDLPSGWMVRRRNGHMSPGPWHLTLAQQTGYGGRRTAALCGADVWTYSDNGHEFANSADEPEGKRCPKCARAAAAVDSAA